MAVLLDTTLISPEDRADAFQSALNVASNPTRVDVTPRAQGLIQAWRLGPDINMIDLRVKAPQLSMARTRQHLRQADLERLSVAASHGGSCVTINHGLQVTKNQQLRLTDVTAPYGIEWQGKCRAVAVEVDYARLGLSVDEVRAAQPQAYLSPLHDILRRHLVDVAEAADELSPQTMLLAGSATVELVRALFWSVSQRDSDRRSAMAQTLPARIEDYVRRHLGDWDLTPARVAAAHNISLRYLYVVLADKDRTPAEWFMTLRLEQARHDLVTASRDITATSQRWGFKDVSHFSRRFKAAYGMTPREWARLSSTCVPDGHAVGARAGSAPDER